eukprot:CAMPEP_0204353334 /NCGR_PEP_ID=MMETSP0469-20131031/32592_1 /ASSEMBLY_ACC=CAM_ASM_000384 /TAXON_ID=2969 /ORGANISM="Oxyrrhis marina" /LENGTH=269 /DNA_ID=CAMNT_0051340233 /DNA_START=17 /DNA_END=826 /DNA_ORIENTATION=+
MALDPDVVRKHMPREFYSRFVEQGLRPDGRAVTAYRKLRVTRGVVNSALGSSACRLGKSYYIAGVRAVLQAPDPSSPCRGTIAFDVNFSPFCSSAFRDHRSTSQISSFVTSSLAAIFESPQVMDLTELCVKPGELAWCLEVSVECVEYDGSGLDAVVLAVTSALEDVRLPPIYDPSANDNQGRSSATCLHLGVRPVAITLVKFDDNVWLVDPTESDQQVGASLTVCFIGTERMFFCLGGMSGGLEGPGFQRMLQMASKLQVDVRKLAYG